LDSLLHSTNDDAKEKRTMVNSEVQTATGKGVTTAACGKVKKAGMFKCPYQTNAGHNSTPINV
jgi:ATP:corrinoid adenosyltransferase